jgi:hypothetical protein
MKKILGTLAIATVLIGDSWPWANDHRLGSEFAMGSSRGDRAKSQERL